MYAVRRFGAFHNADQCLHDTVASDIDDMSDVGEIPSNGVPAHRESAIEAEVEAKDQLQDELADDIGKVSGSDAKEEELNRVTDDEDAEDNGEDE